MRGRAIGFVATVALVLGALIVIKQLAPSIDNTARLALAIGCAVVVDISWLSSVAFLWPLGYIAPGPASRQLGMGRSRANNDPCMSRRSRPSAQCLAPESPRPDSLPAMIAAS